MRRIIQALAVVGIVALPLSAPASAKVRVAGASSAGLGGWSVAADANGLDVIYDNATGLAGIHPVDEADLPAVQSTFSSGPVGSALASVFWPGAAGGNLGSLSGELPIPAPLLPLLSKANDPVKASSQYPAGPPSASYPKGAGAPGLLQMSSNASHAGVQARASVANTKSILSFLDIGAMRADSSASASSTADATASSVVSGISILNGLVTIGSVTSDAKSTSNGHSASGTATTQYGAIKVLGLPAAIGAKGLVLPDQLSSILPIVGPVVQALLQQTISAIGLNITELPASQSGTGALKTVLSGGLRIQLSIPDAAVVPVEQLAAKLAPLFPSQAAAVFSLPGVLQGGSLTVTIGRALASAAASPPFTVPFTPPPTIPPIPVTTPGIPFTPGTPGSPGHFVPGTPGGSDLGGGASASPSFSPTSSASTGGGSIASAKPISLSSPLGGGAVALAILATLAFGFAMWWLARMIAPKAAGLACPLDVSSASQEST